MQRWRNSLMWLMSLVLLAVFSWVLVIVFGSVSKTGLSAPGSAISTAATCVPTPRPPTPLPGPATATPSHLSVGTSQPQPTAGTPYPVISKTTDLSPNVALSDKGNVLVYHCDGTHEMFLTVDPAGAVPRRPGDIIVFRGLPVSAGNLQAPTLAGPLPASTAIFSTAPAATEVVPTLLPYPAPATASATAVR